MLTALASLLGSSAVGSFIGWMGGAANRLIDLKFKDKEMALLKQNQAHELLKLDKERDYMKEEWAQRTKVAEIEGESATTVAGYETMSESYKHDASIQGSPKVEDLRASVRPVLTYLFAFAALTQVLILVSFGLYAFSEKIVDFTAQQVYELVKYAALWVFFQAGVMIGWWFATRPSDAPKFGGK